MIAALISLITPLLGGVVDSIGKKVGLDMDSPALRESKLEATVRLQELLLAQETLIVETSKAQLGVNAEEAKNSRLFVAGWRPFIGWSCGIAIVYHFILHPMLVFVLALAGISTVLPTLDLSSLLPILTGMLGLGAMRTYEKVQGVVK